ncbi:MAG: 23S rRNA (uracil(1939)-C(5))-methyltransferase RlmD [Lachnospirales bacterium]
MKTKIFDLTSQSVGVGKRDEKIVFLPRTVIGDEVEYKIIKEKKNYIIGEMTSIVTQSKYRVLPLCDKFYVCGGCDLLHLDEEMEQEVKENIVVNVLKKDFDLSKTLISKNTKSYSFSRYRNKVTFHCKLKKDKLIFGYYGKKTNDLVEISSCVLADDLFFDVAMDFVTKLNSVMNLKELGLVKDIVIRKNSQNDILLGVILKSMDNRFISKLEKLDFEKIKTLVVNVKDMKNKGVLDDKLLLVKGDGFITESICNNTFDINLFSFFQVNKEQTENLYDLIGDFLGESKCVVDGYCGVGTIAFSLARTDSYEKIIGVEIVKSAVLSANKTLENSKYKNLEFIHGKFENEISKILNENGEVSIVLDPPRKGCDSKVIEKIVDENVEKVVYVSCDISGFVKDMKLLKNHYEISKLSFVNMFPRTKDIETIVLLTKI